MSLSQLDRRVLIAARTRGHSPRRDRAVAGFSRLGEHAGCWLVLGLGGALLERGTPARRAEWNRGAGTVMGAYALNTAIKLTVGRRRPTLEGLPPLISTRTRLSFPSAHATTSFAAARCYGSLIPRAPLYLSAAALALSRLYLGVHYPSDVIAGAAFGTVLGSATGEFPWR